MKSQLLTLLFTVATALCGGCYVQLDDHDGYSNSHLANVAANDVK